MSIEKYQTTHLRRWLNAERERKELRIRTRHALAWYELIFLKSRVNKNVIAENVSQLKRSLLPGPCEGERAKRATKFVEIAGTALSQMLSLPFADSMSLLDAEWPVLLFGSLSNPTTLTEAIPLQDMLQKALTTLPKSHHVFIAQALSEMHQNGLYKEGNFPQLDWKAAFHVCERYPALIGVI